MYLSDRTVSSFRSHRFKSIWQLWGGEEPVVGVGAAAVIPDDCDACPVE